MTKNGKLRPSVALYIACELERDPKVGGFGFWFGRHHPLNIEGPEVCGRWIAQKNYLWEEGGMHEYWNRTRQRFERYWRGIENLPKLFHHGGYFGKAQRKRGSEEEVRVHAVMALVSAHEFEHRRAMPHWGPIPEPAIGGISIGWKIYHEPAPSPDHPVFGHAQLQRSIGYRSLWPARGDSTIVRKAAGKSMDVAFEARDVCIVGLPELFLRHLHTRTAEELYEEWLDAEIIIGKKPPRGQKRRRT